MGTDVTRTDGMVILTDAAGAARNSHYTTPAEPLASKRRSPGTPTRGAAEIREILAAQAIR